MIMGLFNYQYLNCNNIRSLSSPDPKTACFVTSNSGIHFSVPKYNIIEWISFIYLFIFTEYDS